MKYTKLGKSDLNVSRICMGCMGFGESSQGQHGWTLDESSSREIIKYGLENGINFYDTAIAYQNGTSEQFVGRALRDFAKRDDYVIATKFLPRNQEEIKDNVSGQKHIENSLNQSLKNLGMDYVDLYIYHMWDYHTPMEEIMEGLNNAVKSGKARYIDISVFQTALHGSLQRLTFTHGNMVLQSLFPFRDIIIFLQEKKSGKWHHSAMTRILP